MFKTWIEIREYGIFVEALAITTFTDNTGESMTMNVDILSSTDTVEQTKENIKYFIDNGAEVNHIIYESQTK